MDRNRPQALILRPIRRSKEFYLFSSILWSMGFLSQKVREELLRVKVAVVWDAPRSLVDVERRFKGAYCLHHQDQHVPDYTVQHPRRLFILVAVRTSSLAYSEGV
jgi:hypothetical protein